ASVVLGYINPEDFAGGRFKLKPELPHAVIEEKLATPVGISVREAALGIHQVVAAHMVEGIRLVSVRQGYDPRDFTLMPLGGSGGIHICALAADLGSTQILLPQHPGVLSALGMLMAPVEHEISTAFPLPLDEATYGDIKDAVDQLSKQCAELMSHETHETDRVIVQYFADICYIGQSHHIEVPFELNDSVTTHLKEQFTAAYQRMFGHSPGTAEKIVNLRVVHSLASQTEHVSSSSNEFGTSSPHSQRMISVIGKTEPVMAAVYSRHDLPVGTAFEGPA